MTNELPEVLIFWDYDTQWGADRSRRGTGPAEWGALEFPRTDQLLELHARYDILACFAVVGAAARPGSRPYHDSEQIRRIHDAGHEIASHTMHHEWIPGLTPTALRETLRNSKDALEQCTGRAVVSFVPPFNQPFDYASAWSFSLSERLTARRTRTDVRALCEMLAETGYRFCRLAYRSVAERARDVLALNAARGPEAIRRIAGVDTLRLNTEGGFGDEVRCQIESQRHRGGYWLLYGHPHSAGDGTGPQARATVEEALRLLDAWRREGLIRLARPCDLLVDGRSV